MEKLFASCADVVATSGPGGCNWAHALEVAEKAFSKTAGYAFEADEATQKWVLTAFQKHEKWFSIRNTENGVHIAAAEEVIHRAIGFSSLENAVRPKLTMRILYEIARKRESGILQSDLPKLVGIPAASVHHHVLSLFSSGLITREKGVWLRKGQEQAEEFSDEGEMGAQKTSVKSAMTTSVVLKLKRFGTKNEDDGSDIEDDSSLYTNAVHLDELEKRVLEILAQQEGNRSMTVKELKRYVIPDEEQRDGRSIIFQGTRRHRVWRRLRRKLVDEGKVVEEEKYVAFGSLAKKKALFKCLRLATEADHLKRPEDNAGSRCNVHEDLTVAELDPITNIWKLLVERKRRGLTAPEVFRSFGSQIERKLINLILDKIGESEEVEKKTEHEGKQLMIRYILKKYLKEEKKSEESMELECKSIDLPPGQRRRFSTLTIGREQRVLNLLNRERIVRRDKIGRHLAEEEGGTSDRVDTKIVRRLLNNLEAIGKISQIEVPQPGFAGRPVLVRLVTLPGIAADAVEVENFFVESVMAKSSKDQKETAPPANSDEIMVSVASFKEDKVVQRAGLGLLIARLHGLHQGKMYRVKAMHIHMFRYVLTREAGKGPNGSSMWNTNFTISDILNDMRVGEYVKIVGVYENIGPIGKEERSSKLKSLPTAKRKSLIRRKGSSNQVIRMLDILRRMDLIENSSKAHMYSLSLFGKIRDFGRGPPLNEGEVEFRDLDNVQHYWKEVQASCTVLAERGKLQDQKNQMMAPVLMNPTTEGSSKSEKPMFSVFEVYARSSWSTGTLRKISPADMIRMEKAFANALREPGAPESDLNPTRTVIKDLTVDHLYNISLSIRVPMGDIIAYYKHRLRNPPTVRVAEAFWGSLDAFAGRLVLTGRKRSRKSNEDNESVKKRKVEDRLHDPQQNDDQERGGFRRRRKRTWTRSEEIRLLVNIATVKAEVLVAKVRSTRSRPTEFWPEVGRRMRILSEVCRRRTALLMKQKPAIQQALNDAIEKIQSHLRNVGESEGPTGDEMQLSRNNDGLSTREQYFNAFEHFKYVLEGKEIETVKEICGPEGFTLTDDIDKMRRDYHFVPYSLKPSSKFSKPASVVTNSLSQNRAVKPHVCVLKELIKVILRTKENDYDVVLASEMLSYFSFEDVEQAYSSLRQNGAISGAKDSNFLRRFAISSSVRKALSDHVFSETVHSQANESRRSLQDSHPALNACGEGDVLLIAQAVADDSLQLEPAGLVDREINVENLEEIEDISDKRSSNRSLQWKIRCDAIEDGAFFDTAKLQEFQEEFVHYRVPVFQSREEQGKQLEQTSSDVPYARKIHGFIAGGLKCGRSISDLLLEFDSGTQRGKEDSPSGSKQGQTRRRIDRALIELEAVGMILRFHCQCDRPENDYGAWYVAWDHSRPCCLKLPPAKVPKANESNHPRENKGTVDLRGSEKSADLTGETKAAQKEDEDPQGYFPLRPWSSLDGTYDNDILRSIQVAALSQILENPGIERTDLLSLLEPSNVPHAAVFDALAALEHEGRIQRRLILNSGLSFVHTSGVYDAEIASSSVGLTTYHPTVHAFPMSI